MSEDDPRTPVADDRPVGGQGQEAEMEAVRRSLLSLCLGQARFGLWVDEVLEVVRTPPISRLPLPHPEVAGVTSVRGAVIPVLDLGVRLLGEPARRPGRLVLVRNEATATIVGILVDDVETLVTPSEDQISDPPKAAESKLPPELMTGVVTTDDAVVPILHLGRAAAPPEADSNED